MKLLLAIIRDDVAADVTLALNSKGFSVTRVSTTGGFLRRGNVTLLMGVDDERVEEALEVVNAHGGPEPQRSNANNGHAPRRATVFVLGVSQFARY